MDTQGQIHIQQLSDKVRHGGDIEIDLYGFPAGLYFVTIETDVGRVVKKLVKG